jgi:hypothetical protein
MQTNDYTRLPLGTQLEKGEIRKCPQCGKAGLAQESFTHTETYGLDEHGELITRWVSHVQRVPIRNTPLASS